MAKLTGVQVAYVSANRKLPPKKIAKALGTSVRQVERALRALGDAEAIRRAKVRRVFAGTALAVLVGTGGYFALRWKRKHDEATAVVETKRVEAEAKKVEQEIYRALDKGEAGREDEVAARLTDPSESVRLAAVRYMLSPPKATHLREVLDRVDDTSDRVRLATLQLIVRAPDPSATERLLVASREKKRATQERVVALNSLAGRPTAEVRPHARQLLDCLDEPFPAIQRAAHELLAHTVPEAKVAFSPTNLRAAWQSALEVRQ